MGTTGDMLSSVALRNPALSCHWDCGGLDLEVTAKGGRYWRWRYRHGGEQKLMALGVFPEVTLVQARSRRNAARATLQGGADPRQQRKAGTAEELRASQGTCADWLAFKAKGWSPESTRKAEYVPRTYLLPTLKTRKIAILTSKEVSTVLKAMAASTPDLARKARQFVQGIVRHAIFEELRDEGRLLDLTEIFGKAQSGHIPASSLPEEINALLKALRAYPTEVTRCVQLMCAYTAARDYVFPPWRGRKRRTCIGTHSATC